MLRLLVSPSLSFFSFVIQCEPPGSNLARFLSPGGIVCGFLSDVYGGRRACVCATMMCILVPLLFVFAFFMDTMPVILVLVLLLIMGCLVGGPNNIITSAVAADLADDPSIKGNNRALGTVTGIINGSGSVTAAFGQMVIPVLQIAGEHDKVAFRYVWLFLVACTIVGTALLGPKIVKELATREESTADSSKGYQSLPADAKKMDLKV
eukprot:scaffold6180_cov200-Pinguiococcus_pyrenoidosus.AAC.4